MASGDSLLILTPFNAAPPGGTTAAQFDILASVSTPADSHPVIAFDSAVQEYMDFPCILPAHYAGGGLTCVLVATYATATGGVVWEAAIRREDDGAEDLTAAQTYDYNTVTVSSLPAVGTIKYSSITFTSGADMDSAAAGESFNLRVSRLVSDAGDTAAADAQLLRIHIKET